MTTKTLAKNICEYPLEQLPQETIHEAKKSFLNWLGNAIGAHRHPSITMMQNVAKTMNSSPQATFLGTSLKVDLEFAAILNGMSSSMFDFDDTFLETILHPSAPVFPALVAWCEHNNLPGKLVLQNFVIGAEVEERIALALGRQGHYEKGWHITGTAGTFGATAAMGKMLGLSQEQMVYALGIASVQPTGIRTMFGTYTKPIHAGKAASNGILSALLAREGMTSSLQSLEAPKGYCFLMSDSPDYSFLETPWGNDWQIMRNAYKPFACGIVAHPAIDAAIRLRNRGINASDIRNIALEVHPLALELTGKPEPKDTLEAIFSVYHGVAVGLLDGKAGQWEYATEHVRDEKVVNMRKKITATVNKQMKTYHALLKAEKNNGEVVEIFVDKVFGSLENPLKEKDLEEKFKDLTAPYLTKENQDKLIKLVWDLDQQPTLHQLIDLCKAGK
ncbi:MAG: MmgE/PrpD family protein [Negativicutes bacterium]|nr:MmgE/PrpD family protein [Negativicutes bacterium]